MARLFQYFFIYSFAGFVLEVLFARVMGSAKQDRKCMLFLPLCPVYGLGALSIVRLPAFILHRPLPVFVLGAVAATVVEYGMDWLYEHVFRVRFWDYSALKGNLNGRVCLIFSGIWGFLALALVYWVHPTVQGWMELVPGGLTPAVFLSFVLDLVFTLLLLRTSRTTDSLRWYDRFFLSKQTQSE